MKIALITDIHENFQALEKAFITLKNYGFDCLVCMGDITGYSPLFYKHQPDANACLDFLREHALISLAGNHDYFTLKKMPSYASEINLPNDWYQISLEEQKLKTNNQFWLYEHETEPLLTPTNKDFLDSLPEYEILDTENHKIMFSHFFKPDLLSFRRWFPSGRNSIREHLNFQKENNITISFVGHAHPVNPILTNHFFWTNPYRKIRKIKTKFENIICPAVVGEQNPSTCIIFDTKTNEMTTIHP